MITYKINTNKFLKLLKMLDCLPVEFSEIRPEEITTGTVNVDIDNSEQNIVREFDLDKVIKQVKDLQHILVEAEY